MLGLFLVVMAWHNIPPNSILSIKAPTYANQQCVPGSRAMGGTSKVLVVLLVMA